MGEVTSDIEVILNNRYQPPKHLETAFVTALDEYGVSSLNMPQFITLVEKLMYEEKKKSSKKVVRRRSSADGGNSDTPSTVVAEVPPEEMGGGGDSSSLLKIDGDYEEGMSAHEKAVLRKDIADAFIDADIDGRF